ncbi:MAG: glycosyltransferase family 2 protein [Pseudomonadota bacterium]
MKLITVVTPCFNEMDNVEDVYRQTCAVFEKIEGVVHEHLFIDNASTDGTLAILRRLAAADSKVKVIVNARNFGAIRSPYHGLMQAEGDAAILLVADLQDPPVLMADFVKHWLEGAPAVIGVKPASRESALMFALRRIYYRLIARIADVPLIQNFSGYGLYDRQVLDLLAEIEDPYPYLRGLITELGFSPVCISYIQPARARGVTTYNWYRLYDYAMLGITSHSRFPLRLATLAGFFLSGLSLLVSLVYLILKIAFWYTFSVGLAPMLIGLFFFASVQLLFIGLLGEYVGAILGHVVRRPRVVERERINFKRNSSSSTARS